MGQVLQGRADAVAGVVDEEIDAPELVDGPGHDLVDLLGLAHVAGDGQGTAPLGAHGLGDGVDGGAPTTAGDDVRAHLGELDGDGAADALAGAGDDGHAIVERVGGESHGGGEHTSFRRAAGRGMTRYCFGGLA